MEEHTTEPVSGDAGQAATGPGGSQATGAAPAVPGDGQSGEAAGQPTTPQGSGGTAPEDTFFDPRDIDGKPELQAAYKQMQRSYTKKMQALAENRQKIEAYDAFMNNPVEQLQRFATQYGYQMTPMQAAQAAQQMQQGAQDQDWQPQSWNEVMQRATEMAKSELMRELNPVFNEVQHIKKQSIESQLSEIDPTWHEYEDQMKENLRIHPTLARNPAQLYRLSVPQEVLESRATQAALKKLETRQQSAQVSGGSTTNRQPGAGLPDRPVSFAQAVEAAKRALAEKGIRPA